jgi:cell division protein ZipA
MDIQSLIMDLGLREWLLILGSVFIIGILLHGYWRMRANRNSLKMALDKNFLSAPGDEVQIEDDLSMLKAELPNGGARVRKVPEQGALDLNEDVPVLMEPVELGKGEHKNRSDKSDDSKPKSTAGGYRQEHLVVLFVTALDEPFNGQNLLESLVELDMTYGEMNIFHRLNQAGRPVFSLVNAVEPGTFELGSMDRLATPAVSLFMRAHELDDPVEVFDQMLEVAQGLADELGGEVKDDSHSVLTPQTIEHCREEIRNYRHRYL